MREGGGFSPYTSHVMRGEDKIGQCRHIIGPSWVLHLPASNVHETGFMTKLINLMFLFLNWGKQIKPSFIFLVIQEFVWDQSEERKNQ
jgi:hypothetical protein